MLSLAVTAEAAIVQIQKTTGSTKNGTPVTATFHYLNKSMASAYTLTYEAESTTTVEGTLTLQGAEGQLLTLASSAPASHWNLNLPKGEN